MGRGDAGAHLTRVNKQLGTDRSQLAYTLLWPVEPWAYTLIGFALVRLLIRSFEQIELLKISTSKQVQVEELLTLATFLVDASERGTFQRDGGRPRHLPDDGGQEAVAEAHPPPELPQGARRDVSFAYDKQLNHLVAFLDGLSREEDDEVASRLLQHVQSQAVKAADGDRITAASAWSLWVPRLPAAMSGGAGGAGGEEDGDDGGGPEGEADAWPRQTTPPPPPAVWVAEEEWDQNLTHVACRAAWLVSVTYVSLFVLLFPLTSSTARSLSAARRRVREAAKRRENLHLLRQSLAGVRKATDTSFVEGAAYQVVSKGSEPDRLFVRRSYASGGGQGFEQASAVLFASKSGQPSPPPFEVQCGQALPVGSLFRVLSLIRSPFSRHSADQTASVIGADLGQVPAKPMFLAEDAGAQVTLIRGELGSGEVYLQTGVRTPGVSRTYRVSWEKDPRATSSRSASGACAPCPPSRRTSTAWWRWTTAWPSTTRSCVSGWRCAWSPRASSSAGSA